jgi:hypothetical protein
MPRNGSGTFQRSDSVYTASDVWAKNRDASTNILASRHDSHDQDIANALTASIANDGQTPILADLPMSTRKHTGVGNAAARDHYAAAGQVQDGSLIWGGTTGGTTTAYTISLSPAITAYATGQLFGFIANASNTGSATLNVNGVGAVTMNGADGALVRDDLIAGQAYLVSYDSASGGIFHVLNPSITFPRGWATWAPTVTYTGGGSMSGLGTSYKFRRIGRRVEFQIYFSGNVTGTVTAVNLTLPTGVSIPANNYKSLIFMNSGGSNATGLAVVSNTNIALSAIGGGSFPATAAFEYVHFGAELS